MQCNANFLLQNLIIISSHIAVILTSFKLGRCDSYLRNLRTLPTHSHLKRGVEVRATIASLIQAAAQSSWCKAAVSITILTSATRPTKVPPTKSKLTKLPSSAAEKSIQTGRLGFFSLAHLTGGGWLVGDIGGNFEQRHTYGSSGLSVWQRASGCVLI